MVCAAAGRTGHDDDVTRTQQDGDGRDIAREATNKEDCGVSETNGPDVKKDRGTWKEGKAYEIDTRGEVAQISERSTCPIRVSLV
jgi:hypothetical protein